MKIALVIYRAQIARGGAERYTIDLAAALVQRGHEVSLLAHVFDDRLPDGVERVGLYAGGLTRTTRYRRFCAALEWHLRQNRYDIVHAMLPVPVCDLYHPHAGMAVEAATTGRDLLHRLSNRLNTKRGAFARVERQLLGQPHPPLVLCLSDYVRNSVRKYYPLDEAHLPILFNAVDTHKFDPQRDRAIRQTLRDQHNFAADDVVALMIAQDLQRKGADVAIDAMARLPDRRLRLAIVSRESPGKFAAQAQQRGVSDRVHFVGSTDNPHGWYQASDLFVLPTRHDPCSLVVLEALAMGLPVISTRLNGATEIMTDGLHGAIMRNPNSATELADAIRPYLDAQHRLVASEACMQLRPALSYEHHLDRLLMLYSSCGASGSSRI